MSEQYEQDPNQGQQEQAPVSTPSWEEIAAARRITFDDVKAHLTGPVLSFCIHVILITLCLTFVVGGPQEERADIAVEIKEMDIKEIEKMPEPPPEEQVEVDQNIEVESPTNTTATAPSESVSVGASTSEVAVGFSDAPDAPVSNVLSIAPSNSPLVLPGIMAGRSAAGRKSGLAKYGGSSATEKSVTKGLCWLRDHQNADGSWGQGGHSPALTGLATLAFLAHGETPQSQEFGTTVLKAIRKLIEYGSVAGEDKMIVGNSNGYGHAIVTYALAESYALTKIPMIEDAMNKCLSRIVTGQNKYGSFNYAYNNAPSKELPEGHRSDLSVAGWNYQALKAGFAAGSTVKGIETAIDNGIKGIQKIHATVDGGFSYSGGGNGGTNMTPVGTLCLQLLGAGKSAAALKGMKWIENNQALMKCDWKTPPPTSFPFDFNLYQWYYQTQALFQGNSGTGGSWKTWNTEFTKALMREQESDGHWSSPRQKYWKPTGVANEHGGYESSSHFGSPLDLYVYSTSLCCLMLEVYYRYLPTFKVSGGGGDHAGAGAAENIDKKDPTGLSIQ